MKSIVNYSNYNNLQSCVVDELITKVEKYFSNYDSSDFGEDNFETSILINSYYISKSHLLEMENLDTKILAVQESDGSFYGDVHKTILAVKLLNEINKKENIKTDINSFDLTLNMNSVFIKNKSIIKAKVNLSYYSNYSQIYTLKTLVYDGENLINSSENSVKISRASEELELETISFEVNEDTAKEFVIKAELYDENNNLVKSDSETLTIRDKYSDTDVLLIQSVLPWKSNSNENLLNSLDISFDKMTIDEVFNADLLKYRVIILANDQTTSVYQSMAKFKVGFESFVKNGGTLVYGVCDGGWSNGTSDVYIPGDVKVARRYAKNDYIVDNTHPVVTAELSDKVPLIDSDLYHNYASHTYFLPESLPEGTNIIMNSGEGYPTLIEYSIGKGSVIASGLTWEHAYVNNPGVYSKKAFDDLYLYALNKTYKSIDEEPGIVNATITTDKEEYSSNEDVNINIASELTSYKRTVQAVFKITDENGDDVDILDDNYEESLTVGIPDNKSYVWNTSNYLSGKYKIKVTYYDDDIVVSEGEKEFTIVSDGKVSNKVSTDKVSYKANEKVVINNKVENSGTNNVENGLKVVSKITDETGNEVFSGEDMLDCVLQECHVTNSFEWNTNNITPGKYIVTSTIFRDENEVSSNTCEFIIESSEETYSGVAGTLSISKDSLANNETLGINTKLENKGNTELKEAKQKIQIINISTDKVVYSKDVTSSLDKNASESNDYEYVAKDLEVGDYIVTYDLILKDGSSLSLDKKVFKIDYINDDFETDSDLWNYMGSAHRSDKGYAVLTQNKNNQAGAMWLKKGISGSFVTKFKYKTGGGSSADGFTFMFHKKANRLGGSGREMGFKEGNGYAVEFDSFYNKYHGETTSVERNHIALYKNKISSGNPGEIITPLALNVEKTFADKISDDKWHDVEVRVRKDGVEVYVDGERAISYVGEIDNEYDGFGFSAATGTSNDKHYIDDVEIYENSEIPLTTISDDFSKSNDTWTFMGDSYLDENEGIAVLTNNEKNQVGAMWLNNVVSKSYKVEFDYKAGGGTGAEGFVFMFGKERFKLGDGGNKLGFYQGSGYGLEFDSYFNSDGGENVDLVKSHLALCKDKIASSVKGKAVSSLAVNNEKELRHKMNDNEWHKVVVEVKKKSVVVYIDGEKALEYNGKINNTYSGIGFSAASSDNTDYHLIDNVVITEGIE